MCRRQTKELGPKSAMSFAGGQPPYWQLHLATMLLTRRSASPNHSRALRSGSIWDGYCCAEGPRPLSCQVYGCYGGDVALSFTSHKILPRESGCAGAATSEPTCRVPCKILATSDRISARETAQVGTVPTSDGCRRASMWLEDASGPADGGQAVKNCSCLGGAAATDAAS